MLTVCRAPLSGPKNTEVEVVRVCQLKIDMTSGLDCRLEQGPTDRRAPQRGSQMWLGSKKAPLRRLTRVHSVNKGKEDMFKGLGLQSMNVLVVGVQSWPTAAVNTVVKSLDFRVRRTD